MQKIFDQNIRPERWCNGVLFKVSGVSIQHFLSLTPEICHRTFLSTCCQKNAPKGRKITKMGLTQKTCYG